MRLTKLNPETGQYEYKEPAKTQAEFVAQRKAVIQRLGQYEDKGGVDNVIALPCKVGDTVYCIWKYSDFTREDAPLIKSTKVIGFVIENGKAKVIPEDYSDMADRWYMLIDVAFTEEEAERKLAERSRK
jgi:hypothetical protein